MEEESNGTTVNHRKLGVEYFNKTWEYLDKSIRTEEEKQQMIHLAHTSLWHWMNAAECTPTNLSVGYWQISRVYAVVGEPDNAVKYGNICLHISRDKTVGPYYEAYAHEALARAYIIMNKKDIALQHLQEANKFMPEIDEKDGVYLLKDMEQLVAALSGGL